jgi:hypothetical protein
MQSAPRKNLPPFGRIFSEKLKSANPPWLVIVCIGRDCWRSARHWQKNPTVWALVMPASESPLGYVWQVSALYVLVDWDLGPTHNQIIQLVKVLLVAGAEQVTVRPCWVDTSQPAVEYDSSRPAGDRWVQVREQIMIYPGLKQRDSDVSA